MSSFAKSEIGRNALFHGQALSMLVDLLDTDNDELIKFAVSTIHKLLYHMGGLVVAQIRIGEAVPLLSILLERRKN